MATAGSGTAGNGSLRVIDGVTYIADPTPGRHTAGTASWNETFGAGFSLALTADFILASTSARFCMSFMRVGLVPDCGPRDIGHHRHDL